uniref:Uncharacterized protein n=1 Tax=Lepeophtheirus salmonis TaxID=72036 RepID=A0A0K2UVC9_LEPSM
MTLLTTTFYLFIYICIFNYSIILLSFSLYP